MAYFMTKKTNTRFKKKTKKQKTDWKMPVAEQNPHNLFNVNFLKLACLAVDGASSYKNG